MNSTRDDSVIRRHDDEDIGWLKAKVETLDSRIESLCRKIDLMQSSIDIHVLEVAVVRGIIKTVRFLGYVLVALAAFKWGDIKALWYGMLH